MTIHGCDPDGFRATIANAVAQGPRKVLKWYADCEGYRRGARIWQTQFLRFLDLYMPKARRHSSLDIGYGCGSLLSQASGTFALAAGIDVHAQHDFMRTMLAEYGLDHNNFELKQADGAGAIPYDNQTFDLVYSWTVFMHLGFAKIAERYFEEAFRVLRPGGLAIIYFTRVIRTKKQQTWSEVCDDARAEMDRKIPYREREAKVNRINLGLSLWWVSEICGKMGFDTEAITGSSKRLDNVPMYHGQHGIILRRT